MAKNRASFGDAASKGLRESFGEKTQTSFEFHQEEAHWADQELLLSGHRSVLDALKTKKNFIERPLQLTEENFLILSIKQSWNTSQTTALSTYFNLFYIILN